jgi:hypothetical protein
MKIPNNLCFNDLQIKIIEETNHDRLTRSVNNFLTENKDYELVDIQYNNIGYGYSTQYTCHQKDYYSVLILYRKNIN